MQLAGFHHVTAITANAVENHAFYTRVLGMRLVKKTVNQDDVSAYHLFYADGRGSPGTDLTFFDWPARPEKRGTRSITRTGLRVSGEASLEWWRERLGKNGIRTGAIFEEDGRPTFEFEDPEGQRLALIPDRDGRAEVWEKSPVPPEHQICGLGPVRISVPEIGPTDSVLQDLLLMRRLRSFQAGAERPAEVFVYEMGAGGPGAELQVAVEPELQPARSGAGGVHHVAFRAPGLDDYEKWNRHLRENRIPSSGPVERFYFKSLYFHDASGILFEIATDEPGFAVDEPEETLGERLSLPPFLEPRRAEIEAQLRAI